MTLSDDRSEVRLHVGDRVAVKLGPSPLFDSQGDGWDFSLSDPGVLSKLNAAAGPPGPEAVFEARREGHTRLQGTWHLVCQDIATPCSRPSQAFVLEVQVESR